MEPDKWLSTMDAKVWTDEFMAAKAKLGNKEFDHTMMLSWFANAIMAGFDAANRRAQRALDAEREKVKELEEQLRLANCDQVNTENDLNDVTSQLATIQAQLRRVEGERDTARHRVDELEAREIDVEILQGDLRALRAENARFRAVLMNMQAAWNNKNEVTSVYVWNERMMAAMADVDAALRPERGRND